MCGVIEHSETSAWCTCARSVVHVSLSVPIVDVIASCPIVSLENIVEKNDALASCDRGGPTRHFRKAEQQNALQMTEEGLCAADMWVGVWSYAAGGRVERTAGVVFKNIQFSGSRKRDAHPNGALVVDSRPADSPITAASAGETSVVT